MIRSSQRSEQMYQEQISELQKSLNEIQQQKQTIDSEYKQLQQVNLKIKTHILINFIQILLFI